MDHLYIYGEKKYSKKDFDELMQSELRQAKRDSRISTVLKMVEGKKILDVGCYIGVLSRILAEQGKEVIAIDILKSVIDTAKIFNQVEGVHYEHGDIFNMKFKDNEFDCILFLETIEHVDAPTRFLKEFFRILKPGGCLIISTPNSVSYINILHQLLIFFKSRQLKFIESLESEPRNTGTQLDHIYFWDFKTFLRYLIRNGYRYSTHKFVGAPPFNIRIGKLTLNIIGKSEMRFFLPFLGPYLGTLLVKVIKP